MYIHICIGIRLHNLISVSHKYSFLRQEIKAQPDEPVEIKLYRATYEAGDNNLEQMKLYNNNYKPYKTKELYTQGCDLSFY